MLWKQFKNIAIPILSEHILAEEIHQEDKLIRFLSKKDRQYYALKSVNAGIIIGFYGERNSINPLCFSPRADLAAKYLKLLLELGLNAFTTSIAFSEDLLGPVEGTVYVLSLEQGLPYRITSSLDPTNYAECGSYRAARMLAEAASAGGEHP